MGQAPSVPDPNVKLQVIGCGLSRTGTTSFGQALEVLLGGPVYHGGTQIVLSDEEHIKGWIHVLKYTPIRSEEDRQIVHEGVKKLVSGYTVVTDMPPILFTEELVELFPDAKVICTVRDPNKWWDSMKPVVENTDPESRILAYLFALLPTLRYWQDWADAARFGRFGELYYQRGNKHPEPEMYSDHMEYVKRVVPKERLQYFDVKDGWGPLCNIMGCEVPEVPFPRANDAHAVDAFFKAQVKRGLMAWAGLGVGLTATIVIGMKFWRRAR